MTANAPRGPGDADPPSLRPERWPAVKAVLEKALDLPPAERPALLDRACGTDAELRREVESLLAASDAAAGLLSPPTVASLWASGAATFGGDGTPLRERVARALGDDYALERELGGGGMSRVFLARDQRLGRRVVVKILHPDLAAGLSARRFEREIALAARLQHPHVVPLLSAGAVDGLPYYTMPYVEGESLLERLRREGALPVADAVRLLRELADALAYAHAEGVVHRDLKPANVLLSRGHALVADFGVAKALVSATHGAAQGAAPAPDLADAVGDHRATAAVAWPIATATALGMAVGTPAYMAPEQALGDPTTDHRADLYALGVIAYEALAGEHPFAGRTPQQVVAAHLTEAPSPLEVRRAEVPPALAALVARLLAKGPPDRPGSAADVVRALDGLLPALTPGETPSGATALPGTPPGPQNGGRRRRVWVLGTGALVLLTLAGVAAFVSGRRRTAVSGDDPAVATRIAVLPFDNLGPAADDDFAEGLAEAIRGQLATLPALAVIDARSSAQYRGSTKPVREIGRELGVAYVLQGTVQWARGADGTRRVQVQPALVRVTDATTRWAAPYAAEPTDVFRVQADVAERVARALDVALDERQRVEIAAAPTQNPEAYDQFLRGTALEQRALLNPAFNGLQDAAAAYTRAVALDPAFGIAWARLAGSRLAYWDRRGTTRFASPALARVALDSARRLARDAPETRIAGSLYTILVEGDVDHAVGELRVAYRARPSNTDVLLQLGATLFERPGSLNEGLAYLARAAELDPRTAPVNVSHHFRMAGRYAEAIRYADRAIALIPDQFAGYDAKGQALIDGGFGVAAARPVLDSAVARLGATPVTRYLVQAWYNDATGFLGEPYESRLGALTLADYPAPPSAADSSNYYTAKALMWRRRGVSDRAASYCDSVLAHISPAARDVDSVHVPSGNRAIFDVGALAQMQACAGHRAEAMRYAAALRAAQRRSPSTFVASVIAFNLAHTYLFFDDRAAAVAQLERALRPPHYVSAHWVRVDPLYRSLRGYPPFEALLARAPK